MSTAEQTVTEIRCTLMPVGADTVLLPNTAVAEVVGWEEPEPDPGSPDWLAGHVFWRSQRIPVLDFGVREGTSTTPLRARIAVCNSPGGNTNVPFIGLRVDGTPTLVRVSGESIAAAPGATAGDMPGSVADLNGEPVVIPDLDLLELRLQEL